MVSYSLRPHGLGPARLLCSWIESYCITQSCSVAQSCPTLCNPMNCSTPGLPGPSPTPRVHSNSCPLRWWCHPAISSSVIPFSSCLQSFPASGSFQIESVLCIRWPNYWSFNFNISSSNEYSGLISFRIDWFDILTVQGTLKSLLQQHNWKPSILWHSPKSIVCLSNQWWVDSPLNSKSESQFLSILWLYHL